MSISILDLVLEAKKRKKKLFNNFHHPSAREKKYITRYLSSRKLTARNKNLYLKIQKLLTLRLSYHIIFTR